MVAVLKARSASAPMNKPAAISSTPLDIFKRGDDLVPSAVNHQPDPEQPADDRSCGTVHLVLKSSCHTREHAEHRAEA